MPKAVAVPVPSASSATIMLLVVPPVVSTSSMPLPAALISAVMPSRWRCRIGGLVDVVDDLLERLGRGEVDRGRVAVAVGQVEVAELPEARCRR